MDHTSREIGGDRAMDRARESRIDRASAGCYHAASFRMLRDQVAIVTGAGQGIGRAIAVELARAGAHVVVSGRRLEPLEAAAGEARALGRRAHARSCDVRDATEVDRVVAETVREFGRVDLLVNNAGYRIRAPLDQLPRSEWDAMLGTNLTGVFLCCQAVGRVMIQQRAGKIVNITSVAGRSGSRGMAAYAARKYGIRSALPISRAWRLAEAARRKGEPEVVFVRGDRALYLAVSGRLK